VSAGAGPFTICGTDTGVGKTIVTAAIARAALSAGLSVRVLKPVQTGATEDDDAAEIDRLCRAKVARTGWRLAAPLAPSVAARLEDLQLEPAEMLDWIKVESAAAAVVVVETAGGCAVEITDGYDMAHLAADIGFPVVIACRPGLGTLNHTVLTAEHLWRRKASVLGLAVSGYPEVPGLAERTNLRELPRITGLPIVGVIPVLDQVSPDGLRGASDWLAPVLGGDLPAEH
jgi:dethiobiotin synthetase